MKTTDYVSYTIDRFPKGFVFTYDDFISEVNKKEAVIKALNRMAASGKIAIRRFSNPIAFYFQLFSLICFFSLIGPCLQKPS